MDFRFDRIQNHFEGCLQQAGVFERSVEGAQLFDIEIVERSQRKWLVIAAGISHSESNEFFSDQHKRERAIVPMQVTPHGQASILLVLRPEDPAASLVRGKYVTFFSTDVGWVEIHQGCYVRVDGLESPAVKQIRWELDAVQGHREPQEAWLRPWANIVECNPAHAPSHWHINSPPIEEPGRRDQRRVFVPPELRLATGLPNPLMLMLSLANWLRHPSR